MNDYQYKRSPLGRKVGSNCWVVAFVRLLYVETHILFKAAMETSRLHNPSPYLSRLSTCKIWRWLRRWFVVVAVFIVVLVVSRPLVLVVVYPLVVTSDIVALFVVVLAAVFVASAIAPAVALESVVVPLVVISSHRGVTSVLIRFLCTMVIIVGQLTLCRILRPALWRRAVLFVPVVASVVSILLVVVALAVLDYVCISLNFLWLFCLLKMYSVILILLIKDRYLLCTIIC